MRMPIFVKLLLSFLTTISLMVLVGLIALVHLQHSIRSFTMGEQHYRTIVTAATEAGSFAKRAEGHLLIYLALQNAEDKAKFFARCASLREQLNTLDSLVLGGGFRAELDEMKLQSRDIEPLGKMLIETHDREIATTGVYKVEKYANAVSSLFASTSRVRELSVQLATGEVSQESLAKMAAVDEAKQLYARLIALGVFSIVVAVVLSYIVSRLIARPIVKLKSMAIEIGSGKLDSRNDITTNDEIGTLASTLNEMAINLQASEEQLRSKEQMLVASNRQLAANESRYRTVAEFTYDWEFWQGPDGGFIYVSPSCKRITGLDASEFLSNPSTFEQIICTDDIHLWKAHRHDSQAGKHVTGVVLKIVHADGTIRFIEHFCNPIYDSSGSFLGTRGSNRDVTERMLAEKQLQKLLLAVEQSPVSIVITDTSGNIEYVNPKFTQVTGYTFEEARGQNPRILKSGVTQPEEYTGLWETIASGGEWRGELLNKRKNGELFWEAVSISPVKTSENVITNFVAVKEDITERKKAEEALRTTEDRLRQSQKMEAIGRLAGGIAHDFNNMIGVILGYANLIELHLTPSDPLLKSVQAITTAAERSANLTRQLLGFARKQEVAPVPLNLNDSLSLLHKVLMRLVGEDIKLTVTTGRELWNVKIDRTQVDQILTNLASNARDSIVDVGTIHVETMNVVIDPTHPAEHPDLVPGEYVLLAFSDSGKGMDRATQERIFEPFFTTKQKGRGTGLGLATVFGIVKQNDGFIQVFSEVGVGSTFKIFLPRVLGKAEKPIETVKDLPVRGKETVLIVEDEEQLLSLASATLEMYGYTTLAAKSPGDAILLCANPAQRIDLVITDVVMPEMNGKELLERIKLMRPGMKSLYMSGYSADIVANRGVLNEGITFLQKPFTPFVMAKKVREVLDQ
jgi:two-component system, cell cycle sensor histidine kinase and response regulator CckA